MVVFDGHEKSLWGTQTRREEASPFQEAHVAEVSHGEPVNGESESPGIIGSLHGERICG
jgi:hypothetical protein